MIAPTVQRRLLFVGQRPSKRAVASGANWHNGKLAAATLWAALRAIGIDPEEQDYCNIWLDPEPSPFDSQYEESALAIIRAAIECRATIVGMGAVVCTWLTRHGIAHTRMTHPAARGAIRRQERYHRHVAEVLGGMGAQQ